jgi:hypothetical protein
VQTFLPYPDFEQTAKSLDNKRLGKQRVEAYQILNVLAGNTKGWRNHPAVLMWQGFEPALNKYGFIICREWIHRGFNDSLLPKFTNNANTNFPQWLGDAEFHISHQSNLLRKDPEHYGPQFQVSNDIPYYWPTKIKKYKEKI